jgi:hypothetical protein
VPNSPARIFPPRKQPDLDETLELDQREIFFLAGVPTPSDLPSLPAMLRKEYDLPPEAIAEIQKNIERVAGKYRRQGKANN